VDLLGFGFAARRTPPAAFPNPDDPVFTARKSRTVQRHIENGADENKASLIAHGSSNDLQEAIMDFKQGAGRLIRRETAHGAVPAVLDDRVLWSKQAATPPPSGVASCTRSTPILNRPRRSLRVLSTKV
jgi:Rad3-related DNA helicase